MVNTFDWSPVVSKSKQCRIGALSDGAKCLSDGSLVGEGGPSPCELLPQQRPRLSTDFVAVTATGKSKARGILC